MEQEARSCPHYKPYTLWWTGIEKEKLTCPPDFTHNCCDMQEDRMEEYPLEYALEEEDEEMLERFNQMMDFAVVEHDVIQSEIRQALNDVNYLFF